MSKWISLLGLVLACGQVVADETYHVAQTSVASDRNPGSQAKPLRKIAAAIAKANPGDTIVVGDGDYRLEDTGWGKGVIPISRAGTSVKPIVIRAADGASPVVFSFLLKDTHDVTIQGFQFQNSAWASFKKWQDMPIIVRDVPANPAAPIDFTQDWAARKASIEAAFSTYFAITRGLEYSTAIDLSECKGIRLQGNKVDGYWAGIQCRHSQEITIEDNTISHCINGIFSWQPAPSLINSLIQGNRISQCLDNGIDVREGAVNVRIIDNDVTYSGRSHISLLNGTRGCVIEKNRVHHGGYYSESMEYPGSSAISVHSSFETLIKDNCAADQIDLTGIDGNGIILDLTRDGAIMTVQGNLLSRHMGSGLNTTQSPNAIIQANTFVENGWGSTERRNGAGIKLSRNEDVNQTITQNVFSKNRVAGILAYKLMEKQREINSNTYFSLNGTPLIWDGYNDDEDRYLTIAEVRDATKWEEQGNVVDAPPKVNESRCQSPPPKS